MTCHGAGKPGFVYSPLDDDGKSIRLLEVQPTLREGYIQVNLQHYRMPPKYQCLSYMWGDSAGERTILVNHRPLSVRRNLYDFLDIVRKNPFSLPLWIDALCINQSDQVERGHQVQRMGQIYREAAMVVAWLGSRPDLDHVLDFCQDLYTIKMAEEFAAIRDLARALPEAIHIGLGRLCAHPYWSRAWIVQQIVLAQDVYILTGTRCVNLDAVGEAIDCVHCSVPKRIPKPPSLVCISQLWKQRPEPARRLYACWGVPPKPSITCIRWFGHSECSDPRDRVYSILALLEDKTFQVDYGEDRHALFWRTGEHYRMWNEPVVPWILSRMLEVTSSSLEEHLQWKHLSIPVRYLTFADGMLPSAKLCRGCSMPVEMNKPDDIVLCFPGRYYNSHALLHTISDKLRSITLLPPATGCYTRELGADSFEQLIDGKFASVGRLPAPDQGVPNSSSELRIVIPVQYVLQDLRLAETWALSEYRESESDKEGSIEDRYAKAWERFCAGGEWHDPDYDTLCREGQVVHFI